MNQDTINKLIKSIEYSEIKLNEANRLIEERSLELENMATLVPMDWEVGYLQKKIDGLNKLRNQAQNSGWNGRRAIKKINKIMKDGLRDIEDRIKEKQSKLVYLDNEITNLMRDKKYVDENIEKFESFKKEKKVLNEIEKKYEQIKSEYEKAEKVYQDKLDKYKWYKDKYKKAKKFGKNGEELASFESEMNQSKGEKKEADKSVSDKWLEIKSVEKKIKKQKIKIEEIQEDYGNLTEKEIEYQREFVNSTLLEKKTTREHTEKHIRNLEEKKSFIVSQ